MAYLLNLVYLLLLAAAAPWLLAASVRHGKYREGWAAKLWGQVPRSARSERCIWLHAVSVGEVNLLRPLIERLVAAAPHYRILISTTTKTGFELAQRRYGADDVFYCPLDFSWAVRRAFERLQPELLVLAELELWPNLIMTAKRRGVPVAIVNGRLSANSFRGYRRIRRALQPTWRAIDYLGVQNSTYANRFRSLGAREPAIDVTGSLKFDGAMTDRQNNATRRLARLAGIHAADVVFLAGSTQAPEERLAVETFRALSDEAPNLRLILVPRHPQRFEEVAQMLDDSGVSWSRRSQLDEATEPPSARILLVDTIGELGAWWGLAQLAYVGGSMGRRGGQNMIEPAAYGAAVAFGPHTDNFRDVVEQLRQADAASLVSDGGALTEWVRQGVLFPLEASERGRRAQQLVLRQQGATQRTCVRLLELLGEQTQTLRRSA